MTRSEWDSDTRKREREGFWLVTRNTREISDSPLSTLYDTTEVKETVNIDVWKRETERQRDKEKEREIGERDMLDELGEPRRIWNERAPWD